MDKLMTSRYVVQFDDGTYWKGKGGRVTTDLGSAAFLRECDIRDDYKNTYRCSKAGKKSFKLIKLQISAITSPQIDYNAKFESLVHGTSRLVRLPSVGIIKIVRRKGKASMHITSMNSVCINDDIRELFFKDCKDSNEYIAGVYEISRRDSKLYKKWDEYMTSQYKNQFMSVYKG